MRSIARCIRKCLIIGVTVAAFSLSLAPFNEIAVAQPSINIDVIENISLSRRLGYVTHREMTLSNAMKAMIEILDEV